MSDEEGDPPEYAVEAAVAVKRVLKIMGEDMPLEKTVVSHERPVQIYAKKAENPTLFKCVGTIEGAPIQIFEAFAVPENHMSWDKNVTKQEVLFENIDDLDGVDILYTATPKIGPVSARDFVDIAKKEVDAATGRLLTASIATTHEEVPSKQPNLVRGENTLVGFIVEPPKPDLLSRQKCKVTYILQSDVKMSLPATVLNRSIMSVLKAVYDEVQSYVMELDPPRSLPPFYAKFMKKAGGAGAAAAAVGAGVGRGRRPPEPEPEPEEEEPEPEPEEEEEESPPPKARGQKTTGRGSRYQEPEEEEELEPEEEAPPSRRGVGSGRLSARDRQQTDDERTDLGDGSTGSKTNGVLSKNASGRLTIIPPQAGKVSDKIIMRWTRTAARSSDVKRVAKAEQKSALPYNYPPYSPFVIELYENQRRYTIMTKFSTSNLYPGVDRKPYTDKEDNAMPHLDQVPLPDDSWKWAGPWQVVVDKTKTDAEGYMYALNFINEWSKEPKKMSHVRRRLWSRRMERKAGGDEAEDSVFFDFMVGPEDTVDKVCERVLKREGMSGQEAVDFRAALELAFTEAHFDATTGEEDVSNISHDPDLDDDASFDERSRRSERSGGRDVRKQLTQEAFGRLQKVQAALPPPPPDVTTSTASSGGNAYPGVDVAALMEKVGTLTGELAFVKNQLQVEREERTHLTQEVRELRKLLIQLQTSKANTSMSAAATAGPLAGARQEIEVVRSETKADKDMPVTTYDIVAHNGETDTQFKLRFSDIKDMHRALQKKNPGFTLPKLPPSRWTSEFDAAFIEKRRQALHDYFGILCRTMPESKIVAEMSSIARKRPAHTQQDYEEEEEPEEDE